MRNEIVLKGLSRTTSVYVCILFIYQEKNKLSWMTQELRNYEKYLFVRKVNLGGSTKSLDLKSIIVKD